MNNIGQSILILENVNCKNCNFIQKIPTNLINSVKEIFCVRCNQKIKK